MSAADILSVLSPSVAPAVGATASSDGGGDVAAAFQALLNAAVTAATGGVVTGVRIETRASLSAQAPVEATATEDTEAAPVDGTQGAIPPLSTSPVLPEPKITADEKGSTKTGVQSNGPWVLPPTPPGGPTVDANGKPVVDEGQSPPVLPPTPPTDANVVDTKTVGPPVLPAVPPGTSPRPGSETPPRDTKGSGTKPSTDSDQPQINPGPPTTNLAEATKSGTPGPHPAGASPTGPALDPAAAAIADVTAEAVPDPLQGGETASARANDSAVQVRETTLSSLSRATIETTAQIAAQITKRLEGRSTRFEMALTPEGLGRVDVSLEIGSDGQLAARLAFDNPAAALDLRARVDELRRQLEASGFQIAQDGLEFAQRDPSSGQGGFDGRRERAFARADRLNLDADIAVPPAGRWLSLSLTPDRVDMKV
ncbi:flagellar hook-length control protein FliK [Brevundimonas sp.]|uniref:flagellar hook-length control protein FliK n=1 Tax=Brevundimonas sp. TaxID=1871086 RepID=UPI002ABCB95B|nr:flagellar hook-length control protein FliK [Brevundimonas sp.]MDZ4363682.1 flagellar hook-length control protein FliK [Brevundimonas sp.]